jgi:RimJ/RimL family protein N-acetyltransferase
LIGLSTLNQEYQKEWASKQLNLPLPDDTVCLGQVIDGELRAVVVYCNFQGKSCQIHICSVGDHWMSKELVNAIFDYPFEKMGLKVILGIISGNNEKSLKLSRKLGFKDVAKIPDAHNDGDLVILTMRPEYCRWLTLGASNGRRIRTTSNINDN